MSKDETEQAKQVSFQSKPFGVVPKPRDMVDVKPGLPAFSNKEKKL